MKLKVTGFGPFGEIAENPSALLAQDLGRECTLLPVSFRAADDFVASLKPGDRVLMLGVSAKADRMVLETVARNVVGERPDVEGEVRGPAPIHPGAPLQLGGTLFRREEAFLDGRWTIGVDAGTYLCNYLYYQSLWLAPEALAGFVHVPPFEAVDRESAGELLSELAALLESEP